jgi:hypothetical protein
MQNKDYHIITRALRNMEDRNAAGLACIALATEAKSTFPAFNVPEFFIECDCNNGQYFNIWLKGQP